MGGPPFSWPSRRWIDEEASPHLPLPSVWKDLAGPCSMRFAALPFSPSLLASYKCPFLSHLTCAWQVWGNLFPIFPSPGPREPEEPLSNLSGTVPQLSHECWVDPMGSSSLEIITHRCELVTGTYLARRGSGVILPDRRGGNGDVCDRLDKQPPFSLFKRP